MRTYKRKKVENELIDGVEELCRLCLRKSNEGIPIFTNACSGVCTLALRIMMCVGLEIVSNKCLPNIICSECYTELDRYYKFKKKCEVTYQKLKSHLQAVQDNELSKITSSLKNIETDEGMSAAETIEDEINEMETVPKLVCIDENEKAELPVSPAVEQTNVDYHIESLSEDIDNSIEQHIEMLDGSSFVQIQDVQSLSDLSVILPTMLLELGILTRQDNGVVVADEVNRVHLETGDGKQVLFEIVEDDETEEAEMKLSMQETDEDTEKSDVVMKYYMSHTIKDNAVDDRSKGSAVGGACSSNGGGGGGGDGGGGGSVPCGACGARLSSRGAAARHARRHAGLRPHRCAACGRRFAQREVLKRHLLTHDAVRPFQCGACPKSYTQRAALAAHARSHAPPHARPLALHRCPACPKVFLYPSGLSRHMSAHRGREFPCGACRRPFRDRSSLARHRRAACCRPAPAPAPATA